MGLSEADYLRCATAPRSSVWLMTASFAIQPFTRDTWKSLSHPNSRVPLRPAKAIISKNVPIDRSSRFAIFSSFGPPRDHLAWRGVRGQELVPARISPMDLWNRLDGSARSDQARRVTPATAPALVRDGVGFNLIVRRFLASRRPARQGGGTAMATANPAYSETSPWTGVRNYDRIEIFSLDSRPHISPRSDQADALR